MAHRFLKLSFCSIFQLSKSVILTKIRVATMQPVLTWVQTISANVHRVSKEDIVRLVS